MSGFLEEEEGLEDEEFAGVKELEREPELVEDQLSEPG